MFCSLCYSKSFGIHIHNLRKPSVKVDPLPLFSFAHCLVFYSVYLNTNKFNVCYMRAPLVASLQSFGQINTLTFETPGISVAGMAAL